MAISTLTNITVPLANDTSASNQGLLMPKLQYRFRITLENFGVSNETQELTKQVIDASRPTISFENQELHVYNSKVNIAGKHSWNEVTINLRDDVNGNVSKLVGEQLQKQFDFFEQASAASGIDYKFTSRLEILDGGNGVNAPNVLETWEIYGAYLTSVDYGSVAYASSDPVTVALTIMYDNAIQTPVGSGVGSTVARNVSSLSTGGGS
jgi:hypothetical protein|tara:strand:+ start:1295 stop:1921 length:627 start_codon:yes stop_codon:yes gene_type:complete